MILKYLKTEYKTIKRDRWMYYTGKSKEPFELVVLKTDIDKFLDSDEQLNSSLLKVQAQEEKLNLLI